MLTRVRRLRATGRISAETKRFVTGWVVGTSAACGVAGLALTAVHNPASSLLLSCATVGVLAVMPWTLTQRPAA